MSHDRGCSCGKESDEYRQCLAHNPNCNKSGVVQMWDKHKEDKREKKIMPGDINKLTIMDVNDFQTIVQLSSTNALDEYQRIATKTAIYPGVHTPLGLMYVALKGAGEAGEFAEHVGKAMRDDGLANGMYMDGGAVQDGGLGLTSERKEALIKEVGDQLWYLSAKCNELGISLSYAALINLQKLQSRSERGVLQGSGDNR